MSDARLTLARHDLAAAELEGLVPAARYAPTQALRLTRPNAPILSAPSAAAEQVDQLLYGELFESLERQGDFLWGQARRDGYVGFAPAEAFAPAADPPTHRVGHIRTYAFAEP
jgi:hypothetical protein